ncbi:hypothetical protein Gasu2_65500 [Galdieria sulphuraria]|nr:hypothetical protein Gasu2_65500 [Galdieria sulphuraria]
MFRRNEHNRPIHPFIFGVTQGKRETSPYSIVVKLRERKPSQSPTSSSDCRKQQIQIGSTCFFFCCHEWSDKEKESVEKAKEAKKSLKEILKIQRLSVRDTVEELDIEASQQSVSSVMSSLHALL